VVFPEKVMVLDVKVELALATMFPFKLIELLPALKEPLLNVSIPFTVIALFNVTEPEPDLVKFDNAVLLLGNSGPVVAELELLYVTLYAFVVLFGLINILPEARRVIVPPAVMPIPEPFPNMPDVKFKFVISKEEEVVNVAAALFNVSVPKVVPLNPTSDGKVPDPSTVSEEALLTNKSPVVRANAPLSVSVCPLRSRSPSVWVNVPTMVKSPPRVTKPDDVRFNVKFKS